MSRRAPPTFAPVRSYRWIKVGAWALLMAAGWAIVSAALAIIDNVNGMLP